MALDSLTIKFKEELKKRGMVATDSQIESFLSKHSSQSQMPVNVGGNLYNTVSQPQLGSWYTGEPAPSDDKIDLIEGVGSALWHFADTMAFGLPGVSLRKMGVDPLSIIGKTADFEKQGISGKVGAVVGEAAGFLLPMKWVSKGVQLAVKAKGKLGSTRIVDDILEGTGVYKKAGGLLDKGVKLGFEKETLRRTLKTELKSTESAQALASYGVSNEAVKASKEVLKTNLAVKLAERFKKADVADIDRIVNGVVNNLGKPGLHVNSVGTWVQRMLGRRMNMSESAWLSKYAAHATEMAVNFSLYNLLTDGIQSMAGEREFDPAGDVYHALVFSAFLPFVEALPGGGKIPIFRTMGNLNKFKKIYNETDYTKYSPEALSGLLKILTRDNFLKNRSSWGEIASTYAWQDLKKLSQKQLVGVFDDIHKVANLDKIWKEFIIGAGKDLGSSAGRMMAGAFYFNSETLLDADLIRNVEPEVLGAHMLIGAVFTRMRKPIFAEKNPATSNFESKMDLLRNLGIESESAEFWNSHYEKRHITAGALSGVMGNKEVGSIYNILYGKDVLESISTEARKKRTAEDPELGEELNNNPDFNLLLYSKDVADVKRFSEGVGEGKDPDLIDLTHLTRSQAYNLVERLKEVEINEKTGEKLTEDNFDNFYIGIERSLLKGGAQRIVDTLFNIARELDVQTQGRAKDFKLDGQTVSFADIKGKKPKNGEAFAEYQFLLNKLKSWGYIGSIKSPPGTEVQFKNLVAHPDFEEKSANVKNLLKTMTDKLKKDSFNESTSLDILPTDNAWLDLLGRHRARHLLSLTRDAVKGDNLEDIGVSTLHESLRTVFGQDMPSSGSIRTLIDIANKPPEGMKSKEWEAYKATEEYSLILDKLQALARIWTAESNNIEGVNKRKEIFIEDARSLVGSVEEMHPDMFRDNFIDRFEVYHQQREFRDARLGMREAGIIRLARDHNILSKSANDSKWVFMGMKQAREILSEREGLYTEEEISSALKQYDEIRQSLSRIDGKYIVFQDVIELEGLNRSDLTGFITNAHTLTKESQREILGAWKDLSKKTSEQGKVLKSGADIISRLYDHESNAMNSLTLQETQDLILRINELQDIGDPMTWIADPRFINYFESLKSSLENWQKGAGEADVFVASDTQYENGNGLINVRSAKLNRIRETIQSITLNAVGSLNGARHAGRIKQELIASFTRQLRDLEIDIPDGITLAELYENYGYDPIQPKKKGQTDRSIESFASEVDTKLIAFETNMSPEQLASLNQEIARNRDMFSSINDETPSVTYQSIETKYGIFNKNLVGEDFMSMRMDLDQAVTDKKPSKVVDAGTKILREVHDAIDTKNDGDLTKSIAEKMEFNRRFPLILAQVHGTEMIKTISFSENGIIKGKNQTELIIENKKEASGKDASFQRDFQDIGLEIYKVGRTSVYGNRSFTDFGDVPLTSTEKNSLFELPHRVIDEPANKMYPTFAGAKITVGAFDQIYVRTDQLVGKVAESFKEKFNNWYDDIISDMNRSTRRNFETMYKGWRESEGLHTEKGVVRELVKGMYWSHLSREGFIDLVSAANSRDAMNEIGVSLLKYFHTMSTGGPKIQGSKEFLRTIRDIGNREIAAGRDWWGDRQHASQWSEVSRAIDRYLRPNKQKFNVLSVADDSMKGFSALEITRKKLVTEAANYAEGTETRNAYEELIRILPEKFKSLANSGINAQSWLGTDAAHLIYLHRGRNIFDDLAGVKPVGESSMQDILLKTNFVYDKDIADLMKDAGIDILTTESAAKRFGAGHTLLEIGQGRERRRMETEDFDSYSDAFMAAESSLREGTKGSLRIEDLYLGKTTDRKRLASVSYSLTNFLDAIGYGEFTKHTGYYNNLRELLGEHAEIKNDKSLRRNALFSNTLNIARDRGEIFEDGTYGSVDRLTNIGVDVQSTLLSNTVDMMIVRRILGEVSKPGTKYGSYSVLVPFLEGSPSVYRDISGVDKQIKFGGKKLSYFDGEQKIDEWKNVKFIASFRDPIVKAKRDGEDVLIGGKSGHDLQVSIEGGNLVVTDPYGGTKNAAPPELLKKIHQRILAIRHQLNREFSNNPTYKQIFEHLKAKNTFDNKIGGYEVDMFIHSLSLRIPNIGGDIAVHRVEGFYDKSFGNVVGVNAMDLAVKHQADFDVDMLSSLHDMPHKLIDSISKNLGKTPDAHTYPPDDMSDLDMFNMGGKIGQVGKLKEVDTLEPHYNRWRNAQNLFGSIMNISPALGAMGRLEFGILGLPLEGIKSKGMMSMDDKLFKPHQQRLKNVLQSIVDATKETNFVSRAAREDVLKYVLFGKAFGAEKGSKIIEDRLKEFYEDGVNDKGQEKWSGMFDLTEFTGNRRLIMEDAILEIMNTINSSNRVLSGVTDESGRRPPDLRQMMNIRNGIESMFRDVNQHVFNNLLFNYRVINKKTKGDLVPELVDLFFGSHQDSYKERNALFSDIYKKSKRTPIVEKKLFSLRRDPTMPEGKSIPDGEKNLHMLGVGGIILDMFGTRLNDKPGWVTRAKSKDTKKAHDLLDKIESAFMLGSDVNLEEAISVNEYKRATEEQMGKDVYGEFGKVFFEELESFDIKNVQDYSLLYHVLDKESSSLRNFVRSSRGNRMRNNSIMRAQYKLRLFEAAKDHLLSKERDLVDKGRTLDEKTPVQKFFKFSDIDLTKKKRGYQYPNRTREVQYVYSINTTKDARVKYSFVGAVEPLSGGEPGKRFLRGGKKYVVMRNPIRYELMNNRDVQDNYALLEVVGESLPQHISGYRESTDAFHLRLGQLKRDFFELNNETFKMSKKSAFGQRNWMDAKKHEDIMIEKFFTDIMNLSDGTPEALRVIASIVVKPAATTGMVRLTADTDQPILLPSFKMNRRLVLSVERYLHSRWNESEIPQIYDSIFGAYGRAYRRKVNRIMYPTEEGLYRSDLYANDNLYKTRDPLLDLAFDKLNFLYMPNVREAVRGSLQSYGGRQYKTHDAFGNIRRMISYEDLGPRSNLQEHYAKQRNYEDGIDAGAVCP